MGRVSPLLLTFFVLVFGAAAFFHAKAAAQMPPDLVMVMPAADGTHLPGCDECGGDAENGLACFMGCALPALGLLPAAAPLLAPATGQIQPGASRLAAGVSRPPDPSPPRQSLLN